MKKVEKIKLGLISTNRVLSGALIDFYWRYLDIWVCFLKIFLLVSFILFVPMFLITMGKCLPQVIEFSVLGGLSFCFVFRLWLLIDKYII
jgi:hypothetical protein